MRTGISAEEETPLLGGSPLSRASSSSHGDSPLTATLSENFSERVRRMSQPEHNNSRSRRGSMPVTLSPEERTVRNRRESVNLNVHHYDNARALARKDSCICGGVADDYARRAKHWRSDWLGPFASWQDARVNGSGGVFYFVAMWFSIVSLAEVAREDTGSAVGVKEFLLLTAAAGTLQSVAGVQPLLVLRPTGPVVLMLVQLFELTKVFWPVEETLEPAELRMQLITQRFLQFTAVVGAFVGMFMAVIASFELSRWCSSITRFTLEVFELFVCSVTFFLGFERIVSKFTRPRDETWSFGDALFSTALSTMTFALAMGLSGASERKFLNPILRRAVSDYGLALAVGTTVALSFWPVTPEDVQSGEPFDVRVQRVPTWNVTLPTADRPWVVGISELLPGGSAPAWSIPLAAAAAIPVTLFLFIEQTITGLLLQQPAANLTKGSYFYGTTVLTALMNCSAPLLGMPFISCHLSPNLTTQLTYSEDGSVGWIAKRRASDVGISSGATSPASGGSTGANGQGNAVAKTAGLIVSENRLTPLVVYLCIGLSALTPRLLDKIPTAASFGVLCFIGAKSILQGNEFVERLLLLFVPPSEFPQGRSYARVPWRTMHGYTLLQLCCFVLCGATSGTLSIGSGLVPVDPIVDRVLGLFFPFMIVAFVPLRKVLLPRVFDQQALLCVVHAMMLTLLELLAGSRVLRHVL